MSANCVLRIALTDGNQPYLVPMNYGFEGNTIYLHSAREGKKLDIIKKNNNVCFEISDRVETIESEKACNFGTRYRSVIGTGKITMVTDRDAIIKALRIIMRQHTESTDWTFSEQMLLRIVILKIDILSMTGKISG
ncbi:MAG: pyridoxamine 5'-phosphate oxidase family protein, partial [Spirochaetia bacterium]